MGVLIILHHRVHRVPRRSSFVIQSEAKDLEYNHVDAKNNKKKTQCDSVYSVVKTLNNNYGNRLPKTG